MEDTHTLPVTYKGADYLFPLRIVPQGYTYKFVLLVQETEVTFERDDSGDFRALIADPNALPAAQLPEPGLLAAISEVLVALTA